MGRTAPILGSHLRLVPGAASETRAPEPRLPVDDSELLGAVRAGDGTAASAFCRRVRPRVEMTIQRLLGRRDGDVEDIVQMSLIELVQTIHRFRGECSLDTWASTVTAHAVFKHIRRRRLERRIFERAGESEAESWRGRDEASGAAVARDLLSRVREHLAAMDEDRAWAFLLHDVNGFDLREVARIMEVSVAAAQKRLVRGRRELRERLAGDPELADLLVRDAREGGEPA